MSHYHPCDLAACEWAGATVADVAAHAGGEEAVEFGVRWHEGDDDDAICLSQRYFVSREHADEVGPTKVGEYGIVRYTVWQRTHRAYTDGSSWTGPWARVEQGAEVAS